MRYFVLIPLLVACSTNSEGLQQGLDSSVDTEIPRLDSQNPLDTELPPCNGACGAGTVCVNSLCVTVQGTGGSQGTGGATVPVGTGGNTGGNTSTSPGTGGTGTGGASETGGTTTITTGVGGTAGLSGAEPEGLPEPSRDGGTDTGRTCGLLGQPCCSKRVCNVGLTCTDQGCMADAGSSPDTLPGPEVNVGPEAAPVSDAGAEKASCGGVGQACCADRTCTAYGATCISSKCVGSDTGSESCGGSGEACCPSNKSKGSQSWLQESCPTYGNYSGNFDSRIVPWEGPRGLLPCTCAPCGEAGQPFCVFYADDPPYTSTVYWCNVTKVTSAGSYKTDLKSTDPLWASLETGSSGLCQDVKM